MLVAPSPQAVTKSLGIIKCLLGGKASLPPPLLRSTDLAPRNCIILHGGTILCEVKVVKGSMKLIKDLETSTRLPESRVV